MEQFKKVILSPAACAVDLGDGSERGPYVNQDYILQKMGRPHRAVNLMYCYYPLDREWPARISEVTNAADKSNAWGYAYDDYFPFVGEEPLQRMEDIRRHGQDVILTLTCDPAVTDEMIAEIGRKLRPFGRIMLRMNHECTGSWFSFNKRNTYQEVADFFVRFSRVMRSAAPNVQMILCAGEIEGQGPRIEKEDEFTEAYRTADIWAIDEYIALNWAWPNEIAEKDNFGHKATNVAEIFDKIHRSYDRFVWLNGGKAMPLQVAEFNDDGDVLGPVAQAKRVKAFYDLVEQQGKGWFTGITMYQFRDDGRLGLEISDPNNQEVGVEQPLMKTYREIIHRPCFQPVMTTTEGTELAMRWGGADDAEGIALPISMQGQPVFAEAEFDGALRDMNLMLEINGRWFAKLPGVARVDLLPAFWEKPVEAPCDMTLNMFAPPADGRNHDDGTEDWATNYRCVLPALPTLRIRYEGCMKDPG